MHIDMLDLCLPNLLIIGLVINLELMKIIIEKQVVDRRGIILETG